MVFYCLNRRTFSRYLAIIIYLLAGILTDLVLSPLFELLFKSSFIGIRLFTLLEFFLLNTFLYSITKNKIKLYSYLLSITLFLVAFIFENLIQFQNNFDSTTIAISGLTILGNSVLYLYDRVKTDYIIEISNPDFLITISLVLYFSGTFFIYLLSKNNYFENYFHNYFVVINSIFITIRNSFIIVAFINTLKGNQIQCKKMKYNI